MNDSNDEQPDAIPFPEETVAPESATEAPDQSTREAYRDLGDAVKKAFRAGASDAKKAAKDAVPKAGEEFAKGLHDIAYGFAYLAAFGAELARELTPDPVCDGFSEGSEAGRQAAEKMREKRRESAEADETAPENDGEPGGPQVIPVT